MLMPTASGAQVLRPDAAWRRRAELRHREALGVGPAMLRRAGMRALVSSQASAAAPIPGAGDVARALAQPKLGAIVTMRVPLFTVADYCSQYAEVKARVVSSGTRSVLLEDVDAPVARGMDQDLKLIANEVDAVMLDPATLMVGDPLKLDASRGGAGRVAVLVTRALNDFGARNEVIGSGCDLVTRAVAPASNELPVIYMTAPTSEARGYGTTETRDYWQWVSRGRVMHELAHLAMNAERLSRGRYPDEYWLDEALAGVAVESYARRSGGSTWKGDARYATTLGCEVRPTVPSCIGRPLAMFDLFAWLHQYGASSSARSPIGQAFAGDGAFLGGGWWFLRWAIDQYATDERAFVQALVNEPTLLGVANLQARTGRTMSDMLPDFGGTLLLPSITPLVPARSQMTVPSWNWNDVWRGMAADFFEFGGLPLSLKYYDRATFDSGPFTLQGGSVETVDLRGDRAMPQLLGITGPNGAPAPAGLVVQLFRAQ
jgi:hypothetical protein